MAHAGFCKWKPSPESRAILRDALRVFEEYKDYLPLTGRQVFYRLAGAYGYPKNDEFANKLYGILMRARRTGMLPFTHLRDGGGSVAVPQTYADEEGFWLKVEDDFKHFSRRRQTGQEQFIELFCEAPGMMPQLQRVAFPFSIPVYGTRGYTGLSVVSEVARRALMRDVPTTILQVGDLDPSGVGIFETLRDDVEMFVAQSVQWLLEVRKDSEEEKAQTVRLVHGLGVPRQRCYDIMDDVGAQPSIAAERIALTWDQVEEHGLEVAPPNYKDSRSKNWPYEDTAQAEAMPPDKVDLEEADREAIQERLDR